MGHAISQKDQFFNFESNLENTLENYWRIFDVNLAWIRQSDTKAYTVFTIYGISISLVFSNVDKIKPLFDGNYLVMAIALAYLGSSIVAMFFGFRCIQPALKLKFPPSVIFFGSISRTYSSPEEYFQKSKSVVEDNEAMMRELCNQIYINSIIARGKFDDISKSISAFLTSLICLVMIVVSFFL
jgi:hypothetical protein